MFYRAHCPSFLLSYSNFQDFPLIFEWESFLYPQMILHLLCLQAHSPVRWKSRCSQDSLPLHQVLDNKRFDSVGYQATHTSFSSTIWRSHCIRIKWVQTLLRDWWKSQLVESCKSKSCFSKEWVMVQSCSNKMYWWNRWMCIYSMRIHNIWRRWGPIGWHKLLQNENNPYKYIPLMYHNWDATTWIKSLDSHLKVSRISSIDIRYSKFKLGLQQANSLTWQNFISQCRNKLYEKARMLKNVTVDIHNDDIIPCRNSEPFIIFWNTD